LKGKSMMVVGDLINEVKQRIYFYDTDSGGVVYFGSLSKYLEVGFSEWFREYVSSLRFLNKKYGCFFVVKESKQEFKKSIYYDDEICIRTQLVSVKYYSITLRSEIIVFDEVCFIGESTLTPINIQTKIPLRLPEEILGLMKEGKI
jgi:acyl-CoA thioester hydrolase